MEFFLKTLDVRRVPEIFRQGAVLSANEGSELKSTLLRGASGHAQ